MSNVEIIGYVASALLLLAMMMTSVIRLRIINTMGCILYIVYGLCIGSYPVALMNTAIACVNIVYIVRNRFLKHVFKLMEINSSDSLVAPFVNHYRADIQRHFPEFALSDKTYSCAFLIVRNMNIAGIFLANELETGRLFVELDYVIPTYRDFKVGNFLFNENRDVFKAHDIKKITAISGSNYHTRYLRRVGFREVSSDGGVTVFEFEV